MVNIEIRDEAHWLSVRDLHIGGSEVAALFNNWLLPGGQRAVLHAYEVVPEGAVFLGSCSPYTNAYAVYLDKSGKLKPQWETNERMDAGTFLEPAIAEWAKQKFDWKLRKVRRYSTHPTVAGWGASVDYEEHGEGMEPVEIKNIDFLIARDNWIIEGDEVIVPPLHIILQLQHYIGARGSAGGWIVPCIGGNELARGRFERHEPTQSRLADAVSQFWEGVRRGIAPTHVAEYDTVKTELAFGDKSDPQPVADLRGDNSAAAMARRFSRWKKHEKFVEGYMGNLKAQLALKVGLNPKAIGDGFRITWPVISREQKVIPEKIQDAMTYRGGFIVTISK